MHLELDAVGVLRVERLGHTVVALAHECAHAQQALADLGEVLDRLDLPCEVIQTDAALLREWCLRPDREQPEVVVVLRAGRAHEHGRTFAVVDEHFEAERLLVEGRATGTRRARRAPRG